MTDNPGASGAQVDLLHVVGELTVVLAAGNQPTEDVDGSAERGDGWVSDRLRQVGDDAERRPVRCRPNAGLRTYAVEAAEEHRRAADGDRRSVGPHSGHGAGDRGAAARRVERLNGVVHGQGSTAKDEDPPPDEGGGRPVGRKRQGAGECRPASARIDAVDGGYGAAGAVVSAEDEDPAGAHNGDGAVDGYREPPRSNRRPKRPRSCGTARRGPGD